MSGANASEHHVGLLEQSVRRHKDATLPLEGARGEILFQRVGKLFRETNKFLLLRFEPIVALAGNALALLQHAVQGVQKVANARRDVFDRLE